MLICSSYANEELIDYSANLVSVFCLLLTFDSILKRGLIDF